MLISAKNRHFAPRKGRLLHQSKVDSYRTKLGSLRREATISYLTPISFELDSLCREVTLSTNIWFRDSGTWLPVQKYMFRPQVEDNLLQKGGSSQRKVALRFIRSLGSLKREVTLVISQLQLLLWSLDSPCREVALTTDSFRIIDYSWFYAGR